MKLPVKGFNTWLKKINKGGVMSEMVQSVKNKREKDVIKAYCVEALKIKNDYPDKSNDEIITIIERMLKGRQ